MFRKLFLVLGAASLAGCTALPVDNVSARAENPALLNLPDMKVFSVPRPVPPRRANSEIARDFLDLSFELESGPKLKQLSRFEGPIAVRVTGNPPPTMMSDLNLLLSRLRNEAGIDVGRASVEEAEQANGGVITIEAVTRRDIRRVLPRAACFVVPNVSSLKEYRKTRFSNQTSWSALKTRKKIAVFIPYDTSPQEVRTCLHEELAQALGPLNDLYRLSDSVFNDDDMHIVLTGFDMLALRAYYDPELRSGMSRAEAARRIPGILSRLNPAGDKISPRPLTRTSRAWITAIQDALGPDTAPLPRLRASRAAVDLAQEEGWLDHRLAFSHLVFGRLVQSQDATAAFRHFLAAEFIYRQTPGTELHRAYSSSQLAAYAIGQVEGERALSLLDPVIEQARLHENAALLTTLLMLKAEALQQLGRTDEAKALRLDSLGWARYGLGDDWAAEARLRDQARLRTVNNSGG